MSIPLDDIGDPLLEMVVRAREHWREHGSQNEADCHKFFVRATTDDNGEDAVLLIATLKDAVVWAVYLSPPEARRVARDIFDMANTQGA